MTFIVMTILVCVSGWLTWVQCKRELEDCYLVKFCKENEESDENISENEAIIRTRPSDKKVLIYVMVSTLLNIGLLALSYYVYLDKVIYAFKLAMIFQWIITLAFIDYHCYIIPNSLIVAGAGMAVSYAAVEILFASYPIVLTLRDYFFGFLLGTVVFWVSAILSKGSVGMGDIKLFAVLGLLLGWTAVFNLLFFSILSAAVYSIYLLLCRKGNRKTMLPLAPFAYVGMVLVLLMGI